MKKLAIFLLSISVATIGLVSCSDDGNSNPSAPSNAAPTASFSISETSGTTSTVFSFNAESSSDPEDSTSVLEVRWDFDGDGNYDTSWNTDKIATKQYSTPGTYSVKLQVKDTENSESSVQHSIVVDANTVTPGEMIAIPAGDFEMGSTFFDGSKPVHNVTLTHNFEIGKYEVTNKEFCDIMNYAISQGFVTVNSSTIKNNTGDIQELLDLDDADCEISYDGTSLIVNTGKDNRPVIEVTWYGAAFYANMLSQKAGYTALYDLADWSCDVYPTANEGYRLPTEAEWEYTARYNDGRTYPWGEVISHDNANYYIYGGSNNINNAVDIGSYSPTGDSKLSVCDLAGNVEEWCNDINGGYTADAQTNPTGPTDGDWKISRGGSWDNKRDFCRSYHRDGHTTGASGDDLGFRLIRF